jgi:maleylacetoacetate isomerase
MAITLFDYPWSSAAFRVRIALNLKGLEYTRRNVNLREDQQRAPDYLVVNPQGLVPTLIDGGLVLTQSLAILEYLEESYPEPSLLPAGCADRARVRALAQVVACDIHPLDNLRVLKRMTGELKVSEQAKLNWYRHWVVEGFTALEALTSGHPATGTFCHGDKPSLADICLVPQIFNAKRYDCPLNGYPTLMRIFEACMAMTAFNAAQPNARPTPDKAAS